MSDIIPEADEAPEVAPTPAVTRPETVGEVQQPLRRRIRRDRTQVITGVGGSEEGASFPPVFDFGIEWLFTNGEQARMVEDQIVLTFANGTAKYDIAERIPNGFRATLASEEFYDAPEVDEAKAAQVAIEVRAGRIAELAKTAKVSTEAAEAVLIAQGAISAPDTTPTQEG